MSEYGTPCPGCRRVLHVTIELEGGETPGPRRDPDAALLLEEAVVKAGNAGLARRDGVLIPEERWQALVSAREAHRDARQASPIPNPGENEAAAQLVERLAEFRHRAEATADYDGRTVATCTSSRCAQARKLAERLRGGFPEPHIQVVAAECGCSIRQGPPWWLEPCEAHRPRRGMTVAETYQWAATIARDGKLEINVPNATAEAGAVAAREALGAYLDRRAGLAEAGDRPGAWQDFMSAVRNACNELIDQGDDAGHRLREASEPYRAGA